MNPRNALFAAVLCSLPGSHAAAQSPAGDGYPMPRDATVRDLVDGYSAQKQCNDGFLQKFKLSAADCAARVETARNECPAMIADGLPDELDVRLAYRAVGRSRVCLLTTIWQRPYNAEAADRASDALYAKDNAG